MGVEMSYVHRIMRAAVLEIDTKPAIKEILSESRMMTRFGP